MKKRFLILGITGLLLTGCTSATQDLVFAGSVKEPEEKTEELLDAFINGEIPANGKYLYGEGEFYASELPLVEESEEWEVYTLGERCDLDNDGENEQILNGPYGGMYLDASNDSVKVFAIGDGTAFTLTNVQFEDAVWIAYCDNSHGGRETFSLEKYEGADNMVDSFELYVEYYDNEEGTYDENSTFMYRGKPISLEEYEALRLEIFGY